MVRFLLLALLCASTAHARPPAADDADGQAFAKALSHMKGVSDGLREYSVRFYKREYVNGAMSPQEVIDVRFRRPWDVLMTWVGGNHVGRVLLYKGPDWNSGRFVVDPGPLLPVISLDPTSRMARAGSRHTVKDLPMPEVIARFVRDATKVNDHPEWMPDVKDEGHTTIRGEPTRCFRSKLPKSEDPTLYASEIQTCISPVSGLPNGIRAYETVDGKLQLIEEYDYVGFDLAPGLTDDDFDRDALGL